MSPEIRFFFFFFNYYVFFFIPQEAIHNTCLVVLSSSRGFTFSFLLFHTSFGGWGIVSAQILTNITLLTLIATL